jgi:hypothetical protein
VQSCAPKMAGGHHACVAGRPRPGNGPGAADARIETASSPARDGRGRACGIRTPRGPDARVVLHRHVPPADQRRFHRYGTLGRRLEPAGLDLHGRGATVPRRGAGPDDGRIGPRSRSRGGQPAERRSARLSRAAACGAGGRCRPPPYPALQARPDPLRDRIHHRPHGPACRRGRGPPDRLDLPHRFRALRGGLRGAVAPPRRDRLSEALPSAKSPGLHAVERHPARAARSRSRRRGGVGPRRGHRRVPSRPPEPDPEGRAGHGQPVHVPVRGAPRGREAGGLRPGGLSPGVADRAVGRHALDHRRDRPVRSRAQERPRRPGSPFSASSTARHGCRTSTPTAMPSSSRP